MKYYAVAAGLQTGVYTTWKECQAQVKGFKGAKFKSFPTLEAAESYVKDSNAYESVEDDFKKLYTELEAPRVYDSLRTGVAFIGATYDAETGSYGYSYVLVTDSTIYKEVDAGDLLSVQQLAFAGVEILSITKLLLKVRELGVKDLTIYNKTGYFSTWFEKGCGSKNVDAQKFVRLMDKIHATSTTLHFLHTPKHCHYELYTQAKSLATLALEQFKGED